MYVLCSAVKCCAVGMLHPRRCCGMYVPVCLTSSVTVFALHLNPQVVVCGFGFGFRFIDTPYARYATISIHAEKTVYGIWTGPFLSLSLSFSPRPRPDRAF